MLALLARLGFTQEAALLMTVEQGMHDLSDLQRLKDSEAESLCKVLRTPGGTIPNEPAQQLLGAAERRNPGTTVSVLAQNNLKLLCYYLRDRARRSRTVHAEDIDIYTVRSITELKTTEESWKNPTSDQIPKIDPNDWAKNIDSIDQYLGGFLGMTGVPLPYVTRKDQVVVADDDDPNYATDDEEMIARAPHYGANGRLTPTFIADNKAVWMLVYALLREKECYSFIQPFLRKTDGRKAVWALYNHYLGPNNMNLMASAAEAKLQTATYIGEKKRHNFEKYVRLHIDQHAILQSMKQHGHAGLDARSKVRHLTTGIKTNALDSVKTAILANPILQNDFESCVRLFKDFLLQQPSLRYPSELNVSTLSGGDKHNGDAIEDRYYNGAEYHAMSPDEKNALFKMREARGHKPGDGKKKGGGGGRGKGGGGGRGKKQAQQGGQALKKLTRQVAKLAVTVANGNATNNDDSDDDSSDDARQDKRKGNKNRNNDALTRQKAPRKN
jgi:hypothetical protein